MANEKVQRYDPYFKDVFGFKIEAQLWPDEFGDVVLYSDHAALVQKLLGALRAYRKGHSYLHEDGEGNVQCKDGHYFDQRCDLCRKADQLLKGESS